MNYSMSNAILGGIDRGISVRRAAQEMDLNRATIEQQMSLNETNRTITVEKHKADMEKLSLEIDKMKDEKLKTDIYGAWDAKSVVRLNDIINNNDKAKTLFGYQNIDFYPLNPTDAQKDILRQKNIKPENAYFGDKLLPDGSIKREAFDMNKLKIASGYSFYVKQRTLAEQAQEAKTNELMAHIKSLKADTNKNQASANKDNEILAQARQAIKNGSSPKSVIKLLQGKFSNKQIGTYQKQIDTFDRNKPNATKKERADFVDKVLLKSVEGSSSNKDNSDIARLASSQTQAKNMVDNYNPDSYNKSEAVKLEASIKQKLDTATKKALVEDTNKMEANQKMVMSIDRILKEAETGEVKTDKDAIANFKTNVDILFGKDTPQSIKNVNFNTASGLLLAGFMKDISGTAIGVAEAERLSRIFQGGDLADEKFVKTAMSKFASELRENNKILKSNNAQYMPDTVIKFTDYGDTEPKQAKLNEPVAVNPKTGEKLVYRNGNWEPLK